MRTWLKAHPFIGTPILMGIIIGAVAILDYIINGTKRSPGGSVPPDNTSSPSQRSVWNVSMAGTTAGGRTSTPGSAGNTASASGARMGHAKS